MTGPRRLHRALRLLGAAALVLSAYLLIPAARERGVTPEARAKAVEAEAEPAPSRALPGLMAARPAGDGPAEPIASEAELLRARQGPRALPGGAARREAAHPRTLATFRGLRAYPGAPPRVPHGLSAEEARGGRCTTCHERGGYSPRFGAYAPVTPHPTRADCLQCHLPAAALTALEVSPSAPDARCRQCHIPGRATAARTELDWRPAPWPDLAAGEEGAPPPIPHELRTRGDCAACHAGPAAVREIRTSHPERTGCRQCHLAGGGDDTFVHPDGGGRP